VAVQERVRELAEIIRPMAEEDFLQNYWDEKPFVMRRGGAEDYRDLFSYAALDAVISGAGLRHPTFRVAKDPKLIDPSAYTIPSVPWGPGEQRGLAIPERVYDLVGQGHSVVLEDAHRVWGPLGAQARRFEQIFGARAFTNVFFTPAGTRAFRPHYDVQNAFIIQCEGVKHWKVHEPHVVKPTRGEPCPPEGSEPGETLIAVDLSPGDVLFIPRGFVHYGHTTDQPSVHVTLGVLPYTLSDVVRNALKRFDDPWLRELAFADSRAESELPEALDDAFEGLLDRLIEVEPDDALDHLAATFVETSTPRRRGGLAELSRVEAISADTPLRRRPGVLWRAAEREGQLTLSFHGAHVPLDAGAPAAALLAGDDAFPAGRLPAPDPLALARRLVAAGFLTFAG